MVGEYCIRRLKFIERAYLLVGFFTISTSRVVWIKEIYEEPFLSCSISTSPIIACLSISISPVSGCGIGEDRYLNFILSKNRSFNASSWYSVITRPWSASQSSSITITSWATAISRLVRYPRSAVRRAVSANPFRAPWVDMKYYSTVSPSLKLDLIGLSIMRPRGFDIRPRIPAICLIWAIFPLAPELAIM